MISSKFFIINQGMELGDKTPISPLMGAKPLLVFPFSFSLLCFFLLLLLLILPLLHPLFVPPLLFLTFLSSSFFLICRDRLMVLLLCFIQGTEGEVNKVQEVSPPFPEAAWYGWESPPFRAARLSSNPNPAAYSCVVSRNTTSLSLSSRPCEIEVVTVPTS